MEENLFPAIALLKSTILSHGYPLPQITYLFTVTRTTEVGLHNWSVFLGRVARFRYPTRYNPPLLKQLYSKSRSLNICVRESLKTIRYINQEIMLRNH